MENVIATPFLSENPMEEPGGPDPWGEKNETCQLTRQQ